MPTSVNTRGSASGTTRSAVADGAITVRNGQAQTQNVADLSRDTDNANGHIDRIFDKDKVARKLEFAQGIQELGQRVAGDVSSYKMQEAKAEATERLLKANPQYASYSTAELNNLIVKDAGYKAVAEKWGTGGSYSMAAAAVTGVFSGLGAGNLGAAAAGGMAPYIANRIKHATSTFVDGHEQTNVLANTMAHAVAGAVLAQLAGNNAAAGAAGAAGGELMARAILTRMYPGKQASELTQDEKEIVSALGQLAAQLSAGLASGSVEGGVQGAVAGKNAVENNSLSLLLQGAKISVQGCSEFAPCRNFLAEKGLSALLGIAKAKTVLDNLSDSEKEYVFNVARSGKADLIEKLTPEERDAYHYMVGQDQKGLITIFPQPDRDLTIGKLENPRYLDSQDTVLTTPDQRDKNGSSHTGNNEGIPDIGGNTTVTPIPEGSNKDDLAYLALKGKEAEQAARDLGFNKRIPAPKVPFNSHGQPAFFNGKVYISQDIDGHNVTNGWKMFNRKGDRMGTYDSNLNRIKD